MGVARALCGIPDFGKIDLKSNLSKKLFLKSTAYFSKNTNTSEYKNCCLKT